MSCEFYILKYWTGYEDILLKFYLKYGKSYKTNYRNQQSIKKKLKEINLAEIYKTKKLCVRILPVDWASKTSSSIWGRWRLQLLIGKLDIDSIIMTRQLVSGILLVFGSRLYLGPDSRWKINASIWKYFVSLTRSTRYEEWGMGNSVEGRALL